LIAGKKIKTVPKILYGIHWDTSDYVRRSLKHRFLEAKIIFRGLKMLDVSFFYYAYIFHTLFSGLLHPRILHLYYLHRFTKKNV